MGVLEADYVELAAVLPAGEVGITASNGHQVLSFGTWTTGAAWSTIKVPLSIAALRRNEQAAEPLMDRAITRSDNQAAEELWAMLGNPPDAALAVQDVLADGGDPATIVQSQQVRPPYSPFGQTDWSLERTARFAFGLPCVDSAEQVLDRMRSLDPSQRWGLASVDGVPAKSGWGPGNDGAYLVRQLAVVSNKSGTVGIALAANPADGSLATGVATLDSLGGWVAAHRDELPGGDCHSG